MDGSFVEGIKKRPYRSKFGRDRMPNSPPTKHYWYGDNGRRWAGNGKKRPHRSWKERKGEQYRTLNVSGEPIDPPGS